MNCFCSSSLPFFHFLLCLLREQQVPMFRNMKEEGSFGVLDEYFQAEMRVLERGAEVVVAKSTETSWVQIPALHLLAV